MKKAKSFSSCKEAFNLGKQPKFIKIMVNGKKQKLECNHEHGGGWTLIHEMDKKMIESKQFNH